MNTLIDHIFSTINSAVVWLASWQFRGVPFLYYIIGLAITGIILRSIF